MSHNIECRFRDHVYVILMSKQNMFFFVSSKVVIVFKHVDLFKQTSQNFIALSLSESNRYQFGNNAVKTVDGVRPIFKINRKTNLNFDIA